MTCELILDCYGVRIRVVDAAEVGIGPRLAELLPPGTPPSTHETADVCYVLQQARSGGAEPAPYHVIRDGEVRFCARTPDEAAEWLSGEVDSAVALNSRTALFVHAGVVGWRGSAIVIPGRSMTGKSTLVSELIRLGATYYSDEFAVLDDDGHVHPYARTPLLRGGEGANPNRAKRPGFGSVGGAPLPVSLIVSMPYQDGAAWCPRVLTGARAVLPLIDNTLLARSQPQRTLRLAARMAPTVVTLEGKRPAAEIAAVRILEFLDARLDARTLAVGPGLAQAGLLKRAQAMQVASQAAASVAPAKFVVIDDVLEPEEHTRLLEYARAHEADFVTSGVMAPDGASRIDPGFRKSGTIFHADEPLRPLERRLRRLLPHVRRELGVSWFPLGRMELQMAVHQDGGFFGAHTDDGRQEVAGRRLTCVYYLHGTPKRFSGGELLVYDTGTRDGCPVPAGSPVCVEPADNAAVFFPSSLLHEVRPVRRQTDTFGDSRFSVNVWFWVGPSPLSIPADAAHPSAR